MTKAFFYITIMIAALTMGCATWSGPRGRGHSTPFEWDAEADTAMSACQDSRQRQRRELLCDAGILTGARCGGEVSVNYRDSVRLICEQSDSREAAGETRAISRDDCDRLLAADGIPADATGTVRSEAPATSDPMMQRIIAMNPALWQDDHAFCIAITTGYGTPTAGGIAYGGGGPGYGGVGYGDSVPYASAPVVGVSYAGAPPMVGPVGYGGMTGGTATRPYGIVNNVSGYAGGPEGGQRMVWVNGIPLNRGQQTVIRIPDVAGTVLQFQCSNGTTFNRTIGNGGLGYSVVANSDCGWGEF